MDPMSRTRQIVTSVIVLVLLVGGIAWAVWQLNLVKVCLAALAC